MLCNILSKNKSNILRETSYQNHFNFKRVKKYVLYEVNLYKT